MADTPDALEPPEDPTDPDLPVVPVTPQVSPVADALTVASDALPRQTSVVRSGQGGKYRTGDPELDRRIEELLDVAAARSGIVGRDRNRDQLREILTSGVLMVGDHADRLDLKIANTALQEIREAYQVFGPHRTRRKITIFGSARTERSDPLYEQTRELAAAIAAHDWMVITGAGPGIMAAGLEGAGRANALGVTIRLPFESGATEFVDAENLVEMRYFFTRKLALIRESSGFVVMPGGFGTLDETFELLTLLQTGKATPVPVVLLGLGQGYWHAWDQFVTTIISQGYAGDTDRCLWKVTNSVDEAVAELTHFYANFHSLRWANDTLVIRVHTLPSPVRLAQLSQEFALWLGPDGMRATAPLPAEVSDRDQLDLPRVRMQFNRRQPGRLRQIIDALNQGA